MRHALNAAFILMLSLTESALSDGHAAISDEFNADEVTYVVTMTTNKKSVAEIDKFSAVYQKFVEGNEPETLAWQFFRGPEGKIFLIERYKNAKAALQHVINISPGGLAEAKFEEFSDHFKIERILVHGNTSVDLLEALDATGLSLEFRTSISGYSRD